MNKAQRNTVEITDVNKPGVAIYWFDDLSTGNEKFRFLSNFYDSGIPIVFPGDTVEYRTGEHAFAAMKATNEADRHFVNSQYDPNDAKAAGRQISLRSDWEQVKYDAMAAVIRTKFFPGRVEAELLLATGAALLTEGTFWHDEVWGVAISGAQPWQGRNWLGTLLMARRAELVAHRDFGVHIPGGSANYAFSRRA